MAPPAAQHTDSLRVKEQGPPQIEHASTKVLLFLSQGGVTRSVLVALLGTEWSWLFGGLANEGLGTHLENMALALSFPQNKAF